MYKPISFKSKINNYLFNSKKAQNETIKWIVMVIPFLRILWDFYLYSTFNHFFYSWVYSEIRRMPMENIHSNHWKNLLSLFCAFQHLIRKKNVYNIQTENHKIMKKPWKLNYINFFLFIHNNFVCFPRYSMCYPVLSQGYFISIWNSTYYNTVTKWN